METILVLAVAAGLGLIPANIAKNKGHSFGLWWFYGWMLFIVAIIHVQFIKDLNAPQIPINSQSQGSDWVHLNAGQSAADELKKYKDLWDNGVISEEEFMAKKEKLLKMM